MAYMDRHRLTQETDLDDATTWRYKLPSTGMYTAIEMRINCDRYATRASGTVVYPLESCISKIEVLKGGGEVVKSLTGQQLDAMNYWDLGRPNARRYRQEASTGNDLVLFLLGGRGFYDTEFGFDFSKMGETWLEYTYNLHEATAEYFKANDHDISLYGWRWLGDGVPSFRGYFRDRQLDAWTTSAANALKTLEIPIGRRIRRIGVQGKTRATTIGGTVSRLELVVDEGKYSPVVVQSPMDWCMAELSEYNLNNVVGGIDYLIASTEMDLPYWWSYIESMNAQNYGASGQPVINCHGITAPMRLQATTAVAGEAMFEMRGYGFQKCLRIGFDHEYDLSDSLDTASCGKLDLVCTEGAASISAAAFYQDVMPY